MQLPLLLGKFHSGHALKGGAFRVFRTDYFSFAETEKCFNNAMLWLISTLIFHAASKGKVKVSEGCTNTVAYFPVEA